METQVSEYNILITEYRDKKIEINAYCYLKYWDNGFWR